MKLYIFFALSLGFSGSARAWEVDYRSAQTPVKNQSKRGTCAAFSIAAALETMPGTPFDLSEQFLYALVKKTQLDQEKYFRAFSLGPALGEGDFLEVYQRWFRIFGAPPDRYLPYTGEAMKPSSETPSDLERFMALAQVSPELVRAIGEAYGKYGIAEAELLEGTAARDVDKLTFLLRTGATLAIPVGYAMHGPSWSAGNITVASMVKKPNAVKEEYGGHAVTLVGFDSTGFLMKNSWGTEWGEKGYARIPFDYHRLFAGEALIIRAPRIKMPSLDPFARRKMAETAELRAKVQPVTRLIAGGEYWVISYYSMGMRDPNADLVEWSLSGQNAAGSWTPIEKRTVKAEPFSGDVVAGAGFPITIEAAKVAELKKKYVRIGVAVTLGFDPIPDAYGNPRPTISVHREVGSFPVSLTEMVDLTSAAAR